MIKVLDKGYIKLIDHMGSDEFICETARITTGSENKGDKQNRALIRHMLRERHTSPFEFAELIFEVKLPMDTWRQMVRHRTANVSEYSTRYSPAILERRSVESVKWRKQATKNRQGSEGYFGINAGELLSSEERRFYEHVDEMYSHRLELGVAYELARKDLPLSTYTLIRWKMDLHNLLHFLDLRMDSHAQEEIRAYATVIGEEFVAKLFPMVWEAFQDYVLNSIRLSAPEIRVVSDIMANQHFDARQSLNESLSALTKTELKQLVEKCEKIGVPTALIKEKLE